MNSALPVSALVTLVGVLASDTHAAGTKKSSGIDMSEFQAAMFSAAVGTVADAGTIQLEQATTSNFSDAKVLRAAVDLATDTPVQIGVKDSELDVNNGFRYVRASLTGTGGSVKAGISVFGLNARYSPAKALTGATIVD